MNIRASDRGDEGGAARRVSIDPERLGQAVENALAEIEARTLTEQEIEWLRERKLQDERAAWALKVTKARLPLVVALFSALGTVFWWLINHTVTIGKTP